MINPLKWWANKKANEKVKAAKMGKASSGYLSPGARAGIFRRRTTRPGTR